MADTGIFATTQECQDYIGANANTTANAEAYINRFIAEAESQINVESGYNWSDTYSTLNTDVKKILTKAAACLVAINVINYEPEAIGVASATFRRDTLYTLYNDCIKLLREKDKGQIFVQES